MEYSIKKLAQLAGISTRTLRYYDEIGLLVPQRKSSNGYRMYGSEEVDLLQQIMLYRKMGMPLDEIKKLIQSEDFEVSEALEQHLFSLRAQRKQIDKLIKTVEKSLAATKGSQTMKDKEKFEGLKESLLRENEEKYGEEIRAKYGEDSVEASNFKFKNMSQEQYDKMTELSLALNEALKTAYEQGDPSSVLAQEVCAMHKEWLCIFWTTYSKEAHRGVTQMYVDDPRFTEYYDNIAEGSAEFLRDAVWKWTE